MPRLCKMCHAESDGPECDYCARPTVEVDNIYELRYIMICNKCQSVINKKVDHDKKDMIGWPFWEMKHCPVCGKHTIHEVAFQSAHLTSYDAYLEHAFRQELREE